MSEYPFREAVLGMLRDKHLLRREHEDNAKVALRDLIAWEIDAHVAALQENAKAIQSIVPIEVARELREAVAKELHSECIVQRNGDVIEIDCRTSIDPRTEPARMRLAIMAAAKATVERHGTLYVGVFWGEIRRYFAERRWPRPDVIEVHKAFEVNRRFQIVWINDHVVLHDRVENRTKIEPLDDFAKRDRGAIIGPNVTTTDFDE